MHELVEGYVRSAKIAQILDLGGNDWDKQKRVLKAYEFSKVEGKTLFDILDTSFAFRKLQGIEFKVIGKTLEINIPYIEEKTDEELEAYQSRIVTILETHSREVSQIVFDGLVKSHKHISL